VNRTWAAQKDVDTTVRGTAGVGMTGRHGVAVDMAGKAEATAMMLSETPGAGGRSRAERWFERWSEAQHSSFCESVNSVSIGQ
jgi:hypothetical protein